MKRAAGLVEFSRREFCTIAGITALLGSCTDGPTAIGTGPLTGSDDSGPDAGKTSHPVDAGADAAEHMPDAGSGSGAVCASTAKDVGAGTTFVLNKPVYFSSGTFFVVRDAGGLYAVTAVCTHQGATCVIQGTEFYCPRHGATFNFDGDVTGGPTSRKLVHYSMCTMANGHVGVLTTSTVAETTRFAG